MNTSGPKGWTTKNDDYFHISDDINSSDNENDTESETDTETESESSSGYNSGKDNKPKMLKGYIKNIKKYKKILFEDDLLPE
tara:strand:- start:55 stop:300 length:246 start_codon:yes stop_codon:yes gene_type:complete